jgi:hypothetical protein
MNTLRAAVICAALVPSPVLACASCGCTLAADWLSQGQTAQPGTTLSIRYDYVPQTTLRGGTDVVDRAAIPLPTDREIERYTYNHTVTFTMDHQFANDWGLDVQLPVLTRPHSTFVAGTDEPSHSRTNGIGDARVMARWQGLSKPGSITGIEAGLVLPTGPFHQSFGAGPAQGDEVDRGLQPGTGTVQVALGAYHLGTIVPQVGYLIQATGQFALDDRDGYKPGSFVQASAALNYTHWRGITPQLQLTFRATARDSGPNSDHPNSGGEQVNIAPGASIALSSHAQAFGFVELPIYTRVNGYQLVPQVKVSVGVLYHL